MRFFVRKCVMQVILVLSTDIANATEVNVNLDCAALISAASRLAGNSQFEPDPEFDRKALGSSMMHLNAYAIPNRLKEKEAFRQLNARRAELAGASSPSSILDRAKICIRNTPGQ